MALLAPLLAAGPLACAHEGAAAENAGGAVAIGVALNPQRPGMESIYQGVALAVAALNAEAGAKGSGLTFTMRKTAPEVTSAVQIATTLRDDPSVVGVVGHPESGTTFEALPIYEDVEHDGARAVVAVSPTATSQELTGRSDWFFRVCPTDAAASEAVARYVVDSLRASRAAVIYRSDSYGRDWTRSFAAAFRAAGGTVVQRDPYMAGITEWAAYAGYVKHVEADVLLFPGNVEDARLAIRALRAADAVVPFIGGDAASGLEEDAAEFAGARYTAFFDARLVSTPEARAFVEVYGAAHGKLPDQRAALAYDAAMLIGRAVLETGKADRREVRDQIARVGTTRPAMEGAAGRIAFDENHDAENKPVVIATVGAP